MEYLPQHNGGDLPLWSIYLSITGGIFLYAIFMIEYYLGVTGGIFLYAIFMIVYLPQHNRGDLPLCDLYDSVFTSA
jgi:hypothetical protein